MVLENMEMSESFWSVISNTGKVMELFFWCELQYCNISLFFLFAKSMKKNFIL